MDDDADLATSLAIADAILAHGAPGNDELVNMVAIGEQEHQREQTIRNAMLSRTKVNFSLLNMAQEEEGMEIDDE
jgi:alpha-D-ribose 1-methylphosphonate 5-triphosphate synthase subunit PhnG